MARCVSFASARRPRVCGPMRMRLSWIAARFRGQRNRATRRQDFGVHLHWRQTEAALQTICKARALGRSALFGPKADDACALVDAIHSRVKTHHIANR